jgi:hypothetical protein
LECRKLAEMAAPGTGAQYLADEQLAEELERLGSKDPLVK